MSTWDYMSSEDRAACRDAGRLDPHHLAIEALLDEDRIHDAKAQEEVDAEEADHGA